MMCISILSILFQSPTYVVSDAGHDTHKVIASKMGSVFEVTAVHPNPETAREAIDAAYAEIDRIEQLISSWRSDSETSQINQQAGVAPVTVSTELFQLIQRSKKVSALTDGAFDITIGGVLPLWHFKTTEPQIPDQKMIIKALELVSYELIECDSENTSVFLPKQGMSIGFGAIGKGYAANRAAKVLKEHGITGGIVNAGGDMLVFGRDGSQQPWRVSIAHPRDQHARIAELHLLDQAIVTSGDYERFFMYGGVRYSHIIDPRSGWPVQGTRSVTVICPDAEVADAMATALSVMGVDGLKLIDQLKGFMAIVVDASGEIHMSQSLTERMNEVKL
ncbi:MAG: FAD:protein FMN transferase [Acidobacteria bacterium]|nr:FAD:protein FMN transferase [Acidobacteriota bacterium]